ncbi:MULTISPECIES: hypothetical protein [unclassified Pseudomonas]|uniref:hypothetical protein n=1 Tax=unclassified Pseudomonas TaxID=196821 RepID=UPI001113CE52|nr:MULTISPECIES: hypothetical protein [unclassified Pseudomonas]
MIAGINTRRVAHGSLSVTAVVWPAGAKLQSGRCCPEVSVDRTGLLGLRRQIYFKADSITLPLALISGTESMLKRTCALALSMVAILSGTQNAAAADNLFKDYAYDSPITKYTEADGYYDCTTSPDTKSKCIELAFIEHKFTASLVFKNDKLSMVSLLSPLDRELFLRAMTAVKKNFEMVVISDGKSLLDVLQVLGKSANVQEAAHQMTDYESAALNAGNIIYTFIENDFPIDGARDFRRLVEMAPDNVRTADFIVSGVGNDAYMILKFSLPKLDQKKLEKQVNKPVESF